MLIQPGIKMYLFGGGGVISKGKGKLKQMEKEKSIKKWTKIFHESINQKDRQRKLARNYKKNKIDFTQTYIYWILFFLGGGIEKGNEQTKTKPLKKKTKYIQRKNESSICELIKI